ncbi:tumor necrosis factor receptor superfamily member 14-like isoform X1 [Myxocyprinus asiaticus]|uniref:tumor necrosis factor receptor superfamily member 14-like isoform X1 n=1 Tax=Myxocyprinus asiaticus TaxID=70543 RepID=UPI002223A56F|nr:tumor necrosis factor receptor superfamily member 14-like isoform X1 [Myxocyprinus asiaticus]
MWIYGKYVLPISTLILLLMDIVFCMAVCNNAEYDINGQCCPMCDSGKRVYKHCDDSTSTTCVSCTEMRFTDAPNGLTECLPCFVCDASNGLKVNQACKQTSNAVCEPLPGYYCVDSHGPPCSKARKHSTCLPGQYINQTGTEFRDTVCGDCPAGSYSDGTLCKLYTKCESLGKITVKSGTDTADAECSDGKNLYILPLIFSVCGVFLAVVSVTVVIIVKKKKVYHQANQVTYSHNPVNLNQFPAHN